MKVPGLFLAGVVLAGGPVAADAYEDAMLALQSGRFDAAAGYLGTLPEGPRRAEAWVRLHLAAGELGTAFRESTRALAADPEHADLLYQSTRAALWLAAGEVAVERADRLDAVVSATPGLDPSQRAQWRAVAEDFRNQGQAILDREDRRSAAERRGRWTSLFLLATAVTALLVLALRRGPGAPT